VATGVEMIAVSSGVHDAADPYAAAREFVAALAKFPDPARPIAP
jgi:thiamine monophosphate synthase